MTSELPAASPMGSTAYLPAGRASPAELREEIARVAASPLATALLEASGSAAAVLDPHRQVVAVNDAYLRLAGVAAPAEVLGLRPGETLACAHHPRGPDGCGTTPACPSCGAAIALLVAGQRARPAERPCALAREVGGRRSDLLLRVRAAPLALDGAPFLLLTLRDVTAEARREGLARAFLHDLANVATGLQSASLALGGPEEDPDALSDVRTLAAFLTREVVLQRALAADELALHPATRPVRPEALLDVLRAAVERHPAGQGRALCLPTAPLDRTLVTDATLVEHVLINMTLNALEATPAGGRVRVELEERSGAVAFRVWNAGAIPRAVIPRLFQRHFTTKEGAGRGQGTRAMKLFAEALGAQLRFTTSVEDGTWFELELPDAAPG